MIGLKYRIQRHGEDGPVEKVIYLATARYGDAGDSMREIKRLHRKATFALLKTSKRVRHLDRLIAELPVDDARLESLQEQSETTLLSVGELTDQVMDHARNLVVLSLAENYGRDGAEEISGELTERDIQGCLETIETGEQPADFFPSADPQVKPMPTSPTDGSSGESSLSTDSQPGR